MKTLFYLSLILLIALMASAQLGVLRGKQPPDLGIKAGRLKPPSLTRNSVSSQAKHYPDHPQREYADITPFPLPNQDGAASLAILAQALMGIRGITVIEQRPDYLYAQAETRWLKFVDDLEFWVNPAEGVLEVRSASRLGSEDFGVNRQRIETIRAAYLARLP